MAGDCERVGVVLLNLGGPKDLSQIEPFLVRLLSDPMVVPIPWPVRTWLARRIARRRAPMVAEHYRAIGGGSPIDEQSKLQAEALGRGLGSGFLIKYAFRHAAPFIEDAIQELVSAGVGKVLALTAYPQWSQTTSGSSIQELKKRAKQYGLEMWVTPSFPEARRYIQALLEASLPLIEEQTYVLFTAHGLPQRLVDKGDPYVSEVHNTVKALASGLPAGVKHALVFQSRMGPAKWTKPYLTDEIERLGKSGIEDLVLIPVSFVCENLETLYELDIEIADFAKSCGIKRFFRAETPGLRAGFIEGLQEMVIDAVDKAGWRARL